MSNLIIVTGFFGAPICETAQKLAEEKAIKIARKILIVELLEKVR